MPNYIYRARTQAGQGIRGAEMAASMESLSSDLRRRGLLVLSIAPEAASTPRRPHSWNPLQGLPPSRLDIELGLQQLATMLRSGMTLLAALRTVGDQTGRPRTAALWLDIRERVERGETLSSSLTRYPGQFSAYVIQLVRVGEHSGELDQLLTRAAEHLEQTRNTRMMVLNALTYPVLVMVMAIGVAAFMVFGVIPKVQHFLEGQGRALPPITQALLDISSGCRHHLPRFGIASVVLAVGIGAILQWPPARLAIHAAWLRVPVVGEVLRLSGTAAFSRGLGILVESGVTLLDGLKTVEHLVGNLALQRRVALARMAVMRGESLADALAAGHGFLPMMGRMVAVGEATGTLGATLFESARFHEARLLAFIRRLSVMVEPVTILVVGGIVGFVYAAFFLALFSLATAAR